jgi:hypothetical protein
MLRNPARRVRGQMPGVSGPCQQASWAVSWPRLSNAPSQFASFPAVGGPSRRLPSRPAVHPAVDAKSKPPSLKKTWGDSP